MGSTLTKNRKAYYNYEVKETFTAGIMLKGPEVKPIKEGKVSIGESHCYFSDGELYIKNITITEASGEITNTPKKLLLKRKELNKLQEEVAQKGLTIIPLKLYTKQALIKVESYMIKGLQLKRKILKEN